jgi:hypothetical protein
MRRDLILHEVFYDPAAITGVDEKRSADLWYRSSALVSGKQFSIRHVDFCRIDLPRYVDNRKRLQLRNRSKPWMLKLVLGHVEPAKPAALAGMVVGCLMRSTIVSGLFRLARYRQIGKLANSICVQVLRHQKCHWSAACD